MRIGIEFVPDKPIEKILKWTKLAEEAGFDNVWITDHYNNRNVWATLTALALNTDNIMLGPGVTNPFHISPALTASAAVTINELSKGRAVIGMGAGDKVTLSSLGIKWDKPVSAVVESIKYMQALTAGEKFKHDGKVFKVKKAKLAIVKKKEVMDEKGKPVMKGDKPLKVAPKIPIYAGAQGPMMLKKTAMVADGILINASHPKDFDLAMEKIKEGISLGLRKMNIDTDLRLSITATMRKYLADNEGIGDKYPDTLGRIERAFSGEIEMVAKGEVQDPKTVIDPRGYFGVIDIEVLREPPSEESGLQEVMAIIEDRIADHVAMLVNEFGSAGLAPEVTS